MVSIISRFVSDFPTLCKVRAGDTKEGPRRINMVWGAFDTIAKRLSDMAFRNTFRDYFRDFDPTTIH